MPIVDGVGSRFIHLDRGQLRLFEPWDVLAEKLVDLFGSTKTDDGTRDSGLPEHPSDRC